MKYKVGDKVHFEGFSQKGVGKIVASNDYITTKEFIKEVEKLGYEIKVYEANTFWERISNELFDLATKYAKTPINFREEPKKFTLKIPNSQWYIAKGQADTFVPIHQTDYQSTLKYGDKSNTNKIDSIHFTQQEIDMLNNQEFINTLIKEEVK